MILHVSYMPRSVFTPMNMWTLNCPWDVAEQLISMWSVKSVQLIWTVFTPIPGISVWHLLESVNLTIEVLPVDYLIRRIAQRCIYYLNFLHINGLFQSDGYRIYFLKKIKNKKFQKIKKMFKHQKVQKSSKTLKKLQNLKKFKNQIIKKSIYRKLVIWWKMLRKISEPPLD